MAASGLDPKTLVEEAGFDILCPPPCQAVEPSDMRIACCCAHDVICNDDEILPCDHCDSKANCKALMEIMDKLVYIFRESNEAEQNLLARSILVVLRHRGGRFLVCEKVGEGFFEGGDSNGLRVILLVLQKKVELLASRQAQSARAEERRVRKRKRLAETSDLVSTSCRSTADGDDDDTVPFGVENIVRSY
jgi:hypothetical protein